MIPIGVGIDGLSGVFADFDRIERGLQVMRPMWEQFQQEFHSEEKELLNAAPFAPLTPSYAKRKREIYGNKPILQATGALLKSFTEPGAAGSIRRISNLSAEFGSRDPKAIFHQEGTSRMPARPPLAEPNEERYETLAAQYLDELIK